MGRRFNPLINMSLYQQAQVNEAKTEATEAKDRVRDLELALGHMELACQAMWELLRARVGITEEELLTKMREVDLRDGTLDGRMGLVVTACPQCGKPSNTKHSQCIYCGAAIPKPHVFQW